MKNDIKINLRLPKSLCDDLRQVSIRLYGKEQLSRLVRLVLEKYISEVVIDEDNNSDSNY